MTRASSVAAAMMAGLSVTLLNGCGDEFAAGGPAAGGSGVTTSAGAGGSGGEGTVTSNGGAGGSGGHGGGGVAGAEPACSPGDFVPVADTAIFSDDCQGDNHFGTIPFANIGAGTALVRFVVDGDVATLLRQGGRLSGLELELTRDIDCLEGAGACPATSGVLYAYPMRTDWDEGTAVDGEMVPHSGADWCRRLGGDPGDEWAGYGASGSEDRGERSGSAPVNVTQESVEITLDHALHRAWAVNGTGDSYLVAVLLVGDGNAVFVAATRENTVEPPPVLHAQACPE